jgi:hydrogenase maturation protease
VAKGRPAPAAARTVVVGVGEPYRRDDGCGPRVVRALRGRLRPGIDLVERVAETTALIDLWDGAGLVVVVDAMRSDAPVGSVVRWEGEELAHVTAERTTSSHGLSVRDAYELGRALGRVPQRLVLYLIEAGELGPGDTLSPAVAGAVARTAEEVTAEVNAAGGGAPAGK